MIFTLVPMLCCLLVAYLENSPLPKKLRGTFLEKGISLVISYLAYRLIEQPLTRLRDFLLRLTA